VQITAQAYHLRYTVDEDRILLSVDISPDTELAIPITRRMTRNLVAALAKLVSERAGTGATNNPLVRDTVLDFEHSKSVADAVASGNMRDETRKKPLTMSAKPVREVNIVPKANGAIALVFDNSEQLLTLDVARERIHIVISTFIRMAERAGWDFPPIASWLEASKNVADTAGRVVN
jgi:hypothetical protein